MRKLKVVRFDVSRADARVITKIVERAFRQTARLSDDVRRLGVESLTMDVTACHRNGNRLRLLDFLAAPDFDFYHDVNGITRHMDRTTGQLRNCFAPRFSAPKKAARGRTSRVDARAEKFYAGHQTRADVERSLARGARL